MKCFWNHSNHQQWINLQYTNISCLHGVEYLMLFFFSIFDAFTIPKEYPRANDSIRDCEPRRLSFDSQSILISLPNQITTWNVCRKIAKNKIPLFFRETKPKIKRKHTSKRDKIMMNIFPVRAYVPRCETWARVPSINMWLLFLDLQCHSIRDRDKQPIKIYCLFSMFFLFSVHKQFYLLST